MSIGNFILCINQKSNEIFRYLYLKSIQIFANEYRYSKFESIDLFLITTVLFEMEKRSVEEILSSITPIRSKKAYEKAYTEFKKYICKLRKARGT